MNSIHIAPRVSPTGGGSCRRNRARRAVWRRRRLAAGRAAAESHAKRYPQPGHAVRIARAVRQPLSLMERERVVREDIEVRAVTEPVAKPISKSKQWVDVSAARRQLRAVQVALQIPVRDDSAIELQHLMEADSRSGVKRRDERHQVETRVAAHS